MARGIHDDGRSLFVILRNPDVFTQTSETPIIFGYAYAALWTQDGSAVKTQDDFRQWLKVTLDGLNKPSIVKPQL